LISGAFELSEMLSISLNSKKNKMDARAGYKHFAGAPSEAWCF